MNAYRFYRTHQQEVKFLDQYENSPYCGGSPPWRLWCSRIRTLLCC